MSEPLFTFLVPVSESKDMETTISYAARRAKTVKGGRVALLYVVESQEIATWGGVERAMADEAFDRAREVMAPYVKLVEEVYGIEPTTYYCKGEPVPVIMDLIEQEEHISILVVPALTKKSDRNPILKDLTSEKGLQKLKIPLTIVPSECRCDDSSVAKKPAAPPTEKKD